MHRTSLITVLLLIWLLSACAAVDPYPPTHATQGDIQQVTSAPDPIEVQPMYANVTRRQLDLRDISADGNTVQEYYYEEDFWEQVRSSFLLSDISRPAVKKHAAEYARHGYEVERTLRRGEPYLAYILDEVQKYGLPGEVVLLPFIESRYDPHAYSPGRAAGLWQFIPSTGKYFGLKQDWWHDERRDVVASTDAALSYLEKLNHEFNGDWLLTFAAYNAGGGTVRSAIRRNRKAGKPTDFWHLDLPAETTEYIPKLLGICRVIRDPERYRVELPAIDSAPGFAIVKIGNQLNIKVAARLAEMESDELIQINPGFNRWATHPDGPHRLAIPVEKADIFAANLAKLSTEERGSWIRHKTVHGETLSHIAMRYQTSVQALQKFNKLGSTRIQAGKQLLIPIAERDAPDNVAANARTQYQEIPAGSISHKVHPGDSLWMIAKRYQVPLAELKEWNQLATGSLIRPGQQLVIHTNGIGNPHSKNMRLVNYIVRSGDSLYLISKKYYVSIADLQRWNDLDVNSYLQPGQKIKIHIDVTRLTKK